MKNIIMKNDVISFISLENPTGKSLHCILHSNMHFLYMTMARGAFGGIPQLQVSHFLDILYVENLLE